MIGSVAELNLSGFLKFNFYYGFDEELIIYLVKMVTCDLSK